MLYLKYKVKRADSLCFHEILDKLVRFGSVYGMNCTKYQYYAFYIIDLTQCFVSLNSKINKLYM